MVYLTLKPPEESRNDFIYKRIANESAGSKGKLKQKWPIWTNVK